MSIHRCRSGTESIAKRSWVVRRATWFVLVPLVALSQDIAPGTFTVVRSGEACQAITARIIPSSTGTSAECVRVAVPDLQALPATIRYRPASFDADVNSTGLAEIEVALGALIVHGSTTNVSNLTYVCPPPGYNGFSVESGSYCEVLPSTQMWATFTEVRSRKLRQIRVILSNSFPPVESLTPNEPPFGSALYDFPEGIDVLAAANNTGNVLLLCPSASTNSSTGVACPLLPAAAGNLSARFDFQATGYFGTSALETAIPSVWNQNDNLQLLSGMTTHSGSGGLQDVYVNASGFYLHGYDSDIAPPYCYWFETCGYDCQVSALADAKFLDPLGTWNVTWRVEEGGEMAGAVAPQVVRAYIGNGNSPGIVYLNAGNDSQNAPSTALVGIDKVGSTMATSPQSYAYYWYTNFSYQPPNLAQQEPPALCFQSPGGEGDNETSDDKVPIAPTSRADATFRHGWGVLAISQVLVVLYLARDS